VLVEAEAFADRGGWLVDPQFLDVMGSPYLLAHGLGRPVRHATTRVEFPAAGSYRVWVRTMDWVPAHHPGRFRVRVDGTLLDTTFGVGKPQWHWQDGGAVAIRTTSVNVALEDATGFEGRCDAILFTTDHAFRPPEPADDAMLAWRRQLLGIPSPPPTAGKFDLVVVGGGLAGCAAAVTSARLGLSVALVQNRPVLGGNASREIGITPRGLSVPIVDELVDHESRVQAVEAEKTLRLFLGWHATSVVKNGDRIASVDARSIDGPKELRFEALFVVDATGDGAIGFLAGADYRFGREARSEFDESMAPDRPDRLVHGHTIVFETEERDETTTFPDVPWATAVSKDFATIRTRRGLEHVWEYGQRLDPIRDAEHIRDYLLRAIYGTFSTAKRKHPEWNAKLAFKWVGHIAARGESRRLMGDHILKEGDIRSQRGFPDFIAVGSRFFCMHTPSNEHDFRSEFDLTPTVTYWIPFRCLYSRNVSNLLMAGRDISATHVGYTSIKLMKTGGQTGKAVGAAAFVCKKHGTGPRGVYELHMKELQDIVFARGEYKDALTRPPLKD